MTARTSDTHPIDVDWLVSEPGRIGLTIAPGKRAPSETGDPWARDLACDLDRLTGEHAARVLVCLLEAAEMAQLGIAPLLDEARRRGLDVHWLPIRDGGVPPLEAARPLVETVVERAASGQPVVIHCQGGVGRAGTIGGCALVRLGVGVAESIATLKARRDPSSPETAEQAEFIARFARELERSGGPRGPLAPRAALGRVQSAACGAVLGAAIGDAMGHPVEFMSLREIRERFGATGVQGFELFWQRDGESIAPYTDDTQLAEIVLSVLIAGRRERAELDATMARLARQFVRWADAPQGGHRAPGRACLAGADALARGAHWSLAGAESAGGCGSVMRAFPFGLVFADDRERAERRAVEHSRLTHRHPIAFAACAAMAVGTALFARGHDASPALAAMIAAARRHDAGTADMMQRAWDEALAGVEPEITLDRLQGWAAHEAIAAAVYVVARHPLAPAAAILEGANTPGDSDSIATLAGALTGAASGLEALPPAWVRDVERSGALLALALDAAH